MPGLRRLIGAAPRDIRSGIVVGRLPEGRYRVQVGGRILSARSMTPEDLTVGVRVALVRTEHELAIVGRGRGASRRPVEVIIDG